MGKTIILGEKQTKNGDKLLILYCPSHKKKI